MKSKKLILTMLALFIMAASFFNSYQSIQAQENDVDTVQESITELGTYEQVFAQNKKSKMTPAVGEKYAYVKLSGGGTIEIAKLTLNGKNVFCIQPDNLFNTVVSYVEDPITWNSLSEQTKQLLWEYNYYGYEYQGHQTAKYHIATQVLIWQAVDKYYTPYDLNTGQAIDISDEIAEIQRLRNEPKGRPSFHDQTIELGLNTPVTLTDTKDVLKNFDIKNGQGVKATASADKLTVSLTSEDYAKSLTFSQKNFAQNRELNIVYGQGDDQRVIMLATRVDPTPNFKLNFKMLYANVEIEKQDNETGSTSQGDASLSNATFKVYDSSDTLLETIKASNSKVKTKNYPVGTTLKVCEDVAPTGYLLNSNCNTIQLTFAGTNTLKTHPTIIKDNVIKGKIEIAKTIDQKLPDVPALKGSSIQIPGTGFIFDIYLKSTNQKVAKLTTDEDGRAISPLLPYGTYIVKETSRTGYEPIKDFEVFIDKYQKTYFYNIENDVFKSELSIYKVDKETGKKIPAAGIEFKIKNSNNQFIKQTIMYPEKKTVDTFITNKKGEVHLPETLVFGNYSICEIKAPFGYFLEQSDLHFTVDGSSPEIIINFANAPVKGQLTIHKTGEQLDDVKITDSKFGKVYTPIYKNKPLENISFEISAREDIIGQEKTVHYQKGQIIETITTNSSGDAISSKLPLGAYSIKEVKTSLGYVIDAKVYDFDLTYENQLIEVVASKLDLNNTRQKFKLHLQKQLEDSAHTNLKDVYKDIVFGVYANTDIIQNDETLIAKDQLVGLVTLDEQGQIKNQLDLPMGSYYVKELQTHEAFVLNTQKYPFELKHANTQDSIVTIQLNEGKPIINEKRRVDLELTKVDQDNHDVLLNGAVFEVHDKTANTMVGYISSGHLMIKDTAENIEYEIASDAKFQNIVKVVKTDSEYEILLKLEAGTYYSRKVGAAEVSKHTIEDGKAIFLNAIYGHEYEFKEIQAPKSYELKTSPICVKAIATPKTNKVTFTFENERIKVPNTGIR